MRAKSLARPRGVAREILTNFAAEIARPSQSLAKGSPTPRAVGDFGIDIRLEFEAESAYYPGCSRARGSPYPEHTHPMPASFVVRFGQVRYLGEFEAPSDLALARGETVVLHTERGIELGEVLCAATPQTLALIENPARGAILRRPNRDDDAAAIRLDQVRKNAFDVCKGLIQDRRLVMKLVDVEPILGGERIVFYYLAENRVDFRELVKDLARNLRTRIEMRQIGVRDEAKILADYGDCGKPVCCNTHLTKMPPVSMRMAKLQKSTLDPAKISGRCGRLKCCLRYEFDTYQDLESELPVVGARVNTSRGQGRVEAVEILSARVLVELDDRRRVLLDRHELTGGEIPSGKPPHRRGTRPRDHDDDHFE